MQSFEYTVIPAPSRGEKYRGAKTGADRFAYALTTEINRMAENGWEYVRAETLPCEERSGLTSRTTVYHNVMVFRRALAAAPSTRAVTVAPAEAPAPRPLAARPAPAPSAGFAAAAADTATGLAAEPSIHWPDGPEDDDAAEAQALAARVDDYDEPGFDPEPRPLGPADPPPFTKRPPLAAARPQNSAGDETMPAPHRLGPAER